MQQKAPSLPQAWQKSFCNYVPELSLAQLRQYVAMRLWQDLNEELGLQSTNSSSATQFSQFVTEQPQQPPLALLCEQLSASQAEAKQLAETCLHSLARRYGLSLCTNPSLAYVRTGLKPDAWRAWQAVPFSNTGNAVQAKNGLTIGCAEPYSAGFWLHRLGNRFPAAELVLITPQQLTNLLQTTTRLGIHAHAEGEKWLDLAQATRLEQIDLRREQDENSIITLCHSLFAEAIATAASDLHIEMRQESCVVLVRTDGMLYELLRLNHASGKLLQSRIKLLSRLDITEQRRPQDGRISVLHQGKRQEIRVALIPTIHGEKIVLRFFDPLLLSRSLQGLGMPDQILAGWKQLLERKAGMLLTVGPTGSGKTSTLYASLDQLATASVHICTVEDPVEIIEPRFSQVQVQHELSLGFAQTLKHLLRQDPDIIMIGEIRDGETATTAVQAALTGHLVLASLHTTDALGAVLRLRELGVAGYLLGSTLVGVIAQRLVRRVCNNCDAKSRKNCEQCRGSGYSGRHAIFELLECDQELIDCMEQRQRDELAGMLKQRRHQSLWRAGMQLVDAGVTNLQELRRVCPVDT